MENEWIIGTGIELAATEKRITLYELFKTALTQPQGCVLAFAAPMYQLAITAQAYQ